jgi:AcrR family transcriptional regulator
MSFRSNHVNNSANIDKAEKRRSEIIAAAFDMFAQKGYHATRIADIAGHLNIGHGTFYRYFKNKLDIFSAVFDEIAIRIGQVVANENARQTNSAEEYRAQLHRIGAKLFDLFNDYRTGKILFYEILGIDAGLNQKIDRAWMLFDRYTEQYLINGVQKEFLKPGLDTLTLSKAINSMIFGAMKDLMSADNPGETYRGWMDAIALLMLEGMR